MNSFATLANNLLEKKLASGELSIIKPKKQENLPEFDYSKEDLIKARAEKICPFHYKPLFQKLNGDYYCDRLVSGRGSKRCGFFMKKTAK